MKTTALSAFPSNPSAMVRRNKASKAVNTRFGATRSQDVFASQSAAKPKGLTVKALLLALATSLPLVGCQQHQAPEQANPLQTTPESLGVPKEMIMNEDGLKQQFNKITHDADIALYTEMMNIAGSMSYFAQIAAPSSDQAKLYGMLADFAAYTIKTNIIDTLGIRSAKDIEAKWTPDLKPVNDATLQVKPALLDTMEGFYKFFSVLKKDVLQCNDANGQYAKDIKMADDIVRLSDLEVFRVMNSKDTPQDTLEGLLKFQKLTPMQKTYFDGIVNNSKIMAMLETKKSDYTEALNARLNDSQLSSRIEAQKSDGNLQALLKHSLDGHPGHTAHCQYSY